MCLSVDERSSSHWRCYDLLLLWYFLLFCLYLMHFGQWNLHFMPLLPCFFRTIPRAPESTTATTFATRTDKSRERTEPVRERRKTEGWCEKEGRRGKTQDLKETYRKCNAFRGNPSVWWDWTHGSGIECSWRATWNSKGYHWRKETPSQWVYEQGKLKDCLREVPLRWLYAFSLENQWMGFFLKILRPSLIVPP